MSGSEIVETAKGLLGTKYKYSGSTPEEGFDCSGFVKYVLSKHGISVPHSSSSIFAGGVSGDGSEGDVVCWNGHCGFCDGSGNVIHAYGSGNKAKVRIDSISQVSGWDKRQVLGYRRYY